MGLNDVLAKLKKEEVAFAGDYEHVPEELGGDFRLSPQPGSYRLRIPQAIEACFAEPFDVQVKEGTGENRKVVMVKNAAGEMVPKTKQRIALDFSKDHALVITQSRDFDGDGTPDYNGQDFQTRISNAERPRWVGKGVPMVDISDMTYLLRALAPGATPRTNEEFVNVCLQALAGKEFGADIEWSGFCNPAKEVKFPFPGEDGTVVYETALVDQNNPTLGNKKGCGKRKYQKDWPKEGQLYADRAQCECGAVMYPFAQLVRYKP